LIRLPELHLELEPTADRGRIEDTSRGTIPLMAAPADSGPPPGSQADESRPAPSASVGGESAAAGENAPARWRPPPWSAFRVPRSAFRGGIALGLVAVLVIAFLAILGPSPKPGSAVAQGESTPAVALPAASAENVPPAGLPAQAGLPAPPAPDTAAGAAAPAAPAKDAAKQEEGSTEEAPAAAATGGDDNQPSSVDAAASGGPPAAPAPAPDQPEARAPQEQAGTAAPVSAPDSGNKPSAPAPADTGPLLTSEPAPGDPGSAGEVHSYPVTNPTTFQYPPDYHERLLPHARSTGTQNFQPAPSGAGLYDRSPSTARLQPPIEPPPVR